MTKTGVLSKRMVGWSLKPLWSDFRPRTCAVVELTNRLPFSLVLRASRFVHCASCLALRASCFGPPASCIVLLDYGQCLVDEGLGGFVHHLRPPGTSWRCLDQISAFPNCALTRYLHCYIASSTDTICIERLCLDQISALNDFGCNQIYLQPYCWKWATSESEYVALSLWIPFIKENNGQDGRVKLPS